MLAAKIVLTLPVTSSDGLLMLAKRTPNVYCVEVGQRRTQFILKFGNVIQDGWTFFSS